MSGQGSSSGPLAGLARPYGPGASDASNLVGAVTAIASIGAGVIHLSAAADHTNLPVMMAGFIAVAMLQVALGGLLLWRRPSRLLIVAALALMLGSIGIWLLSRTIGIPFLPGGHMEPIGFKDGVTVLFEIASVFGLLLLMSRELPQVSLPSQRLGTQTLAMAGAGAFLLLIPALMLGGGGHHSQGEMAAMGGHSHGGEEAAEPGHAHGESAPEEHASAGHAHARGGDAKRSHGHAAGGHAVSAKGGSAPHPHGGFLESVASMPGGGHLHGQSGGRGGGDTGGHSHQRSGGGGNDGHRHGGGGGGGDEDSGGHRHGGGGDTGGGDHHAGEGDGAEHGGGGHDDGSGENPDNISLTYEPAEPSKDGGPGRGSAVVFRSPSGPYEEGAHSGETHHSDAPCNPTPEQQAAADKLFDETNAVLRTYDNNPAKALADGFHQIVGPADRFVHMINFNRVFEGTTLNAPQIESFMYAQTDRGLVAIGGMYIMPAEFKDGKVVPKEPKHGPQIGGCLTQWHKHGGWVAGFTTGGTNWEETPEMLHVWTYPGLNPWKHYAGRELSQLWAPWKDVPSVCRISPGGTNICFP